MSIYSIKTFFIADCFAVQIKIFFFFRFGVKQTPFTVKCITDVFVY